MESQKRRFHVIYASKSTKKNYQGREAMEGNYKPYAELVEQYNESFLSSVKAYRPLTGDVAGTLSGDMFFAYDARKRGLIDQVGTFNDAMAVLRKKITEKASPKAKAQQVAAQQSSIDAPIWLQNPVYAKAGLTADRQPRKYPHSSLEAIHERVGKQLQGTTYKPDGLTPQTPEIDQAKRQDSEQGSPDNEKWLDTPASRRIAQKLSGKPAAPAGESYSARIVRENTTRN